jgi:hypothetical protein
MIPLLMILLMGLSLAGLIMAQNSFLAQFTIISFIANTFLWMFPLMFLILIGTSTKRWLTSFLVSGALFVALWVIL